MDSRSDDDCSISPRPGENSDNDKSKKKSSTSKILGLLKRRSSSKKDHILQSKSHPSSPHQSHSSSKSDAEDGENRGYDSEPVRGYYADDHYCNSNEENEGSDSSPMRSKHRSGEDHSDKSSKELSKKERKTIKKEEKKEQKRLRKVTKKAQKDKLKKKIHNKATSQDDTNLSDLISTQAKADEVGVGQSPIEVIIDPSHNIILPESAIIPPRVTLQDFRIIKLIGKGGFGEVCFPIIDPKIDI